MQEFIQNSSLTFTSYLDKTTVGSSQYMYKLLTRCSAFVRYWSRKGSILGQHVRYFKKFYKSVNRMHFILLLLNSTYYVVRPFKKMFKQNKVRRGKGLSDESSFQNRLKRAAALLLLIFNSALEYAITKAK
jgi:hypothetical protein